MERSIADTKKIILDGLTLARAYRPKGDKRPKSKGSGHVAKCTHRAPNKPNAEGQDFPLNIFAYLRHFSPTGSLLSETELG